MAAFDVTGLRPLDAAGLTPFTPGESAPRLNVGGLKRLNTSGLKPVTRNAAVTDYPIELGKSFLEGAKNLPASSLKGIAAGRSASPAEQEILGLESAIGRTEAGQDPADAVQAVQVSPPQLRPVTENPIYRAGEAIEEFGKETLSARPGFEGQSWTRDIGSGFGSVAAGIGTSLLSPSGALLMFVTAGQGEAAERAVQAGATPEQVQLASRFGTVAGATDVVDALLPALGSTGRALGLVKRVGYGVIAGALAEGGQEGLQQFIQNAIAKGIYKPDQDLLEDVPRNMAVGMIVGGGISGAVSAAQGQAPVQTGVNPQPAELPAGAIPVENVIGADLSPEAPAYAATPEGDRLRNIARSMRLSASNSDFPTQAQQEYEEADRLMRLADEIDANAHAAPQGSPPASISPGLTGQPASPASAPVPAGLTAPLDAETPNPPVSRETLLPEPTAPLDGGRPLPEPAGRFTLKKLLDDPRSAEEIRADMAAKAAELELAAKWVPTADWQEIPRVWADSTEEPRFFTAQGEVPLTFKAEGGKTYARIAPDPGTRAAPIQLDTPEAVYTGVHRTADPTPAQAEAGNYPKRHLKWNGLDIAIETEAGRERTGIGADGVPWSTTLQHPYGYIKRTVGKDGDHLDVYLGPDPQSPEVYVVDQIDPDTLKFDEHKLIIGARDDAEALAIYSSGFSDGSARRRWGGATVMSPAELKTWLAKGDTKKPLAYQPPRRPQASQGTPSRYNPLDYAEQYRAMRKKERDRGFGSANTLYPFQEQLSRARGEGPKLDALQEEIRDLAKSAGINATGEEIDRAAERAMVNGADPIDALVEVIEESYYATLDELILLEPQEGVGHADDGGRTDAGRAGTAPPSQQPARAEAEPAAERAPRGEQPGESQPARGEIEDGERWNITNALKKLAEGDSLRDSFVRSRLLELGLADGEGKKGPLTITDHGRKTLTRLKVEDDARQAERERADAELNSRIEAETARKDGESDADYYRRLLDLHYHRPRDEDGTSYTITGKLLGELSGEIERVKIPIEAGAKVRDLGVSFLETPVGWSFGIELQTATNGVMSSASVWPHRFRKDEKDDAINADGFYNSRIEAVAAAAHRLHETLESIATRQDSVTSEAEKRGARRAIEATRAWLRTQLKGNRSEAESEARETGPSDSTDRVTRDAEPSKLSSTTIQSGVNPQPAIRLAQSLLGELKSARRITTKTMQDAATRAYGGTLAEGKFDRKDMQDALELAVNMMIRDREDMRVGGRWDWKTIILSLEALVKLLPTQRVRSEEMEKFQQFSTPPHYAAAAAYAANLRDGDVMLEPSAGTGSLVAAASMPGVKIIANELSERRAAFLRKLIGDDGRVFTENAEQIDNILPDDVKPTVVLMNPPFSQTAGRMGDKKVHETAAVHIEEALNRLEPGGRLVAIAGQGMVMGHPRFRVWWDKIGKQHTIRANIGVSGKVYEKYGTTFGTRLIVIDKVAASAGHKPVLADAQTVEDLMRILEPIRNERPQASRVEGEQQRAEPGGADKTKGSEGGSTAAPSVPVEPRGVGAGERRPGRMAGEGSGGSSSAGGPDVRLDASERGGVAIQQPERPAPHRAGTGPAYQNDDGGKAAAGSVVRAQRNLEPTSGRQPGPATSSERVELETTEPGAQSSGEISESLYQSYEPQRVRTKGAKPHPGPLVESASMSSVNPPAPTYTPHLPKSVIEKGLLSNAQLEPIVYAGQAHSEMLPAADGEPARRKGYFIGDGTGVGKGREVAGIILDNWSQGRTKAVWVSEKQTLIQDARRDWTGLEQNGNLIFNAGKVKSGEKIEVAKGIGFITYDTLKGGMSDQAAIERGQFVRKQKVSVNGQSGVVAKIEKKGGDKPAQITINLDNKTRITAPANEVKALEKVAVKSRVDQLVEWLGEDFDGVLAFDEAHNMGNAAPSKTDRGLKEAAQKALAGIELQRRLPNARVVYVSATGATEVNNLAYADRLGLWGRGTPFESRAKFVAEIEKGGIAAMELIARDMKQLGLYTARNLSYDGVEYDRIEHKLDDNQREIYDTLAEAWQGVLRNIDAALEETGGEKDGRAKAAAYSAFWGAHQRFFNQIVTAMQMPSVIEAVEKDLAEGRQAVLQLTNTNEASQERSAAKATTAEEIEDLDITPRDQIIQLVEKSFPTQEYEPYRDEEGKERSRPVVDRNGNPVQNKRALRMREALIERLASIRVPQGPLDMVLDHFGVDTMAEVTGRGRRFVLKPDEKTGDRRRVEDTRPGSANLAEADAFQSGKKKILIFSEAGGTGRSYHADNTAPSKDARRAHYLVQGGWRADKAVQGFGRTHRTNQASAPIVKLVTTDLQGQKRFISSIARRLAQLGALTKGQRQAGDQGVFSARDNLESIEATHALRQFFNDLLHDAVPGIRIDEFEQQTGLKLRIQDDEGRVTGAKDEFPPITQFLNRLLSLKIDMQNKVFDAFSERLDRVIEARRQAGLLDVGLETIRADKIAKDSEKVVHTIPGTDAETKYVKLTLSNKFVPLDFEEVAKSIRRPVKFFARSPKGKVYAVADAASLTDDKGVIVDYYRLTNPVSGSHHIPRKNVDTGKDWSKIDRGEAEKMWKAETDKAPEFLTDPLHLVTGAILPIWDRLKGNPRVVRLQTDAGERFIGRVIPHNALAETLKNLGAEADAPKVTPDSLFKTLMEGGRARLTNGWTLKRSRVANENRIELVGPATFSEGTEVKQDGVFSERIEYKMRYFVPTGEAEGPEVLGKLLKFRQVVEVAEAGHRPDTAAAGDDPMFASGDAVALPGLTVHSPFTDKFLEHAQAIYPLLRRELDRLGLKQVGLKLADTIELMADGKIGTAYGLYLQGTITLSLDGAEKFKTLNHEALHGLRRLGVFTDAEWSILTRASNARWRRQFDIDRLYAGGWQEWVKVEEGIAHAYAAWADGTLTVDGRIARLFKRIRDFLEAVGNALRGEGFKTAEDIFRDIKSGRFAARDPETGRFSQDGQIAYAIRSGDGDLFKTEIVQTPDGPREQFVIPGAEKAGDKQRADRGAARPLKPGKAQKGTDGLPLFDDKQPSMFSEAASRPAAGASFEAPFLEPHIAEMAKNGASNAEINDALAAWRKERSARRQRVRGWHPMFALRDGTKSEAFKRWFGNSKVVDENGEPLVVYHGTTEDFDSFDPDRTVEGGFFFTADPHHASEYGGDKATFTEGNAQVKPVYLAIKNPLVVDGLTIPLSHSLDDIENLIERAKAKEHDGVYIKGFRDFGGVGDRRRFDTYIAFRPEQIKSATGNRGTFDPKNPDIRFALRREPGTAMERQRVMQGFIARGQPVDRAIRLPFDWFGGIDEKGQWKPGVKLFDKASRVITGAKFSPEGRFAFLNPLMETARTGLIDRYGLDPKYVTRDRERALDERAVMLQGAEALKSLKDHSVGPAEAKVLQAMLTGEDVTDADMAKLAEPIRAAIDQLGQEAVALGQVSAESFARNRGTYLHRVFQKYEAEQHGLTRMVNSIMGAQRKKIIGNQFRGRGLFQEVDLRRLMRDVPEWHDGARGKPENGEKFVRLDEEPNQRLLPLVDENAGTDPKTSPLRTVYWPADQDIPDRYEGFRNQGVWEVRGEKNGKLVLWRDFTKEERTKMGEIVDARYTIGKTFMLMAHDLAVGKFYKDIAENEEWTRNATPNAKWLDASEWSAQRQRAWKHGDIEWVRVPETEIPNSGGKKRWGALSGRWVREEIWRDLNEIDLMSRPGVWRSLLTQWKLNKTARSPVVHMNNVMSNFVLMDMIDVRWQDLAAGIRSFLSGDEHYQEASRHGAFGADMITQEIREQVLKPILEELQRNNTFQQGGRLGVLGQVSKFTELLTVRLHRLDKKMRDAYKAEDEIFRMATYMRRRELGDDPKQAAAVAREHFIDYDIRAPWVVMARNSVLPFISYTYRAAPLVAKAIATRPWKLAKYFLLAYAANAMAYALTGGDEDRERRSLREPEQGFTWIGAYRMIRMPWNDKHGNPVFLDIRRWIPAGDIFDMSQGDLPAWLNVGGPLMIGAELFLNRSAFTRQEIVNDKTDDWWDRAKKRGDHLYKSWMPSAAYIPGSWYWEKVGNAVKGATDSTGRPYDIGNSLASSVGVKLKPQDVEDAFKWKAFEFQQVERALEAEARRLGRRKERGLISEAEFNRAMQRVIAKKEKVGEKARETLK